MGVYFSLSANAHSLLAGGSHLIDCAGFQPSATSNDRRGRLASLLLAAHHRLSQVRWSCALRNRGAVGGTAFSGILVACAWRFAANTNGQCATRRGLIRKQLSHLGNTFFYPAVYLGLSRRQPAVATVQHVWIRTMAGRCRGICQRLNLAARQEETSLVHRRNSLYAGHPHTYTSHIRQSMEYRPGPSLSPISVSFVACRRPGRVTGCRRGCRCLADPSALARVLRPDIGCSHSPLSLLISRPRDAVYDCVNKKP